MKRSLSLIHSEEAEEDINLTPLIDVVFVVLIMFILVAPLVEIDRIHLAPSGGEKKADMTSFQENGAIKIHVYEDNTIWLNGVPLNIQELSEHLRKLYHTTPSASPQIFHDRKGYFGTYQAVKNAVESAGFSSVDVILKPG
ncbi:MAG: biopolymer transporter ExbD [Chlamydiia bacterium]|nr:biopolymer transporter ExbD [Chlamydiia bacterium]